MATSAFGKAFRAAREAGDKEFEFDGKKYNTKLKEEVSESEKKTPTETEKKREMAAYLSNARQTAGSGTSDLAKSKIKEASESATRSLEMAQKEESMKNYKPRYTPPVSAPKTTEGATYNKKPYMPEEVDMGYKKGGSVSSASSRGDGIAQRGKTRGRIC
jgi:hypothetical protein